MRVVFAGTPQPALPTFDALVRSDAHEVVGVITRPDAPVGRGRKLATSPVGQRAAELAIDVVKPASAKDPELAQWLSDRAPDVVVVVAYGALIPSPLLQLPPHGWVNLHFSLLPAWRGAAPVQHSLLAGETHTGVSVFELVPALDAGPVYRQTGVDIGTNETAGELLDRLAVLGAHTLLDALAAISAGEMPVPQPDDGVTLAPKVLVGDARIDWGGTASHISNVVRGTNPAPGAWTELDGQRFKVLRASLSDAEVSLTPGELLASKKELLVGTGAGVLRLDQVQAFGKKPMSGADWARGVDLHGAVLR